MGQPPVQGGVSLNPPGFNAADTSGYSVQRGNNNL